MRTGYEDLEAGLHELADSEPVASAPVDQLMDRGKRARQRRGSAAVLGVVAAVAVGALGVATINDGMSNQRAAGAQEQPVSTDLVAAAQATARTTFSIAVTDQSGSHKWNLNGAYDPVARKGFLRTVDHRGVGVEQRIIGDDTYLVELNNGDPRQSHKLTGRKGFSFGAVLGADGVPLSVEPGELLATLQTLDTVEDLGDGRYSFRLTENAQPDPTSGAGTGKISGTVEIGADTGKIAKVVYKTSDGHMLTLEFANYGAPVEVQRP